MLDPVASELIKSSVEPMMQQFKPPFIAKVQHINIFCCNIRRGCEPSVFVLAVVRSSACFGVGSGAISLVDCVRQPV